MKDTHGRIILEDANLGSTQWYREVCPKLVRIATRQSNCKEVHIFVGRDLGVLSTVFLVYEFDFLWCFPFGRLGVPFVVNFVM